MISKLEIEPKQLVFDPFCGTGTTLVECMTRNIHSVGLDASPFSCFVSRVKTVGRVDAGDLLSAFVNLKQEFYASKNQERKTSTYKYLETSGMLDRKWIGRQPLREAIALKEAIKKVSPNKKIENLFMIALISDLSTQIGNMRYGPEIYRGRDRIRVDVWEVFQTNFLEIIRDLEKIERAKLGSVRVLKGDARKCGSVLRQNGINKIHAAISSPPYPTEHDYTRNTRLELAFLDFVSSNDSVRKIKKEMIRSHTKGIYSTDQDAELVSQYSSISRLAELIEDACLEKTHGFARLYGRVMQEYFGGMKRHFQSMGLLMKSGGKYAVVVGDQASYLGIQIPTAKLLGEIASDCGFEVDEIVLWRERWATKTSKLIKEHALILKKV